MIRGPAVRGFMLIVFGLPLFIDQAHSAVRDCGVFVDGSGEGLTEKEARTKALDEWTKKVETLGMENARWRAAADRALDCEATSGVYRCRAHARPCVMKQVAPKGWTPFKRRDPLKEQGL